MSLSLGTAHPTSHTFSAGVPYMASCGFPVAFVKVVVFLHRFFALFRFAVHC